MTPRPGVRHCSVRRLAVLADSERGSGSIAVVLFAIVAMGLAGLVIDGGLAISQREKAADIAEQAARRVANDVDLDALRGTGQVRIPADGDSCRAEQRESATAVLRASGVQDTAGEVVDCAVEGGQNVTVSVRLRYRPLLLGLFFTDELQVTGEATAYPAVGVNEEGT